MKNNIKDLSEELIKSVHSLEGFNNPMIDEELVRNLASKLEERIKVLHKMYYAK
jgi:hypothetical protein